MNKVLKYDLSLLPRAHPKNKIKYMGQGWKNGSVAKNNGCSSRGPRLNSKQLHNSSQPSVTSVSGDPMPFSEFSRNRNAYKTQTHTHKIIKENK